MMGFGGNSAPPYKKTIDETLPKHNSLGNLIEEQRVDPYAFALRVPQDHWQHLHHPSHVPNSLSNSYSRTGYVRPSALPSTSTYCQPSPNFYSPHTISGSHFPQYPPSAIPSSSSRSLLSTPSLVPSERFLQIDYSQMPGLAHTAQWGGSRDQLMDEEQRRRLDRSSLYSDYGVTAIQHHLSGIEPLSESNYMKWKSQIDIVLGHLEYDVALLELKPDEPEETSSEFVKEKYQKWIKANRMCILIIQSSIPETIRAGIPEADSAKELMDIIRVRFVGLTKPLVGAMIAQLCKMKYYGQGSVREHLDKMVNLVHKLKELKMELPDGFLVHMAINSLPKAYESLKVNFNSTDERWSVNELIARCIQEEARLVQGRVLSTHSTNLKATKKEMKKSANKKSRLGESVNDDPVQGRVLSTHSTNLKATKKEMKKSANKKSRLGESVNDDPKCFFCKMDGHRKKDCIEFKKWLKQHKGGPKHAYS